MTPNWEGMIVGLRFINASFTIDIWLIPEAKRGAQPEQAIGYVSSGLKRILCKRVIYINGNMIQARRSR
jgi:hypothetical protein